MGFELRLRRRADMRRFVLAVTAAAALAVTLWDHAVLPSELFGAARLPNTLIVMIVAAAIAGFAGARPHRIEMMAERLTRPARHDHLTAAITRMRFHERCRQESEALFPAMLLMLDIDHFKAVNDHHGHKAGDKALHHVARTICRNCRASDLVARFGGAEFAILMPGATEADGAGAAERIRRRIAAATVAFEGARISATVSVGVAPVGAACALDGALQAADAALHRAKQSGRDQVCIAAAPDEAPIARAARHHRDKAPAGHGAGMAAPSSARL